MASYGLQVLAEPKDDNDKTVADIVFVHGLLGNRKTTWTKDDTLWPKDLLADDIQNARILTFGYDSHVTKFDANDEVTRGTMESHVADICDRLTGLRAVTETTNRPIIFVAHSLGGLICAKVLVMGETKNSNNNVAIISNFTRGMMINIVSTTNNYLITDLDEKSSKLHDLAVAFPEVLSKRAESERIGVSYFFETLRYKSVMVVDEDSAWIPGWGDHASIRANHHDICKFATKEDQGYQSVKEAIKKILSTMQVQDKGCGEGMYISGGHFTNTQIAQKVDKMIQGGNFGNVGTLNYGVKQTSILCCF